jgi:hypothetical protein
MNGMMIQCEMNDIKRGKYRKQPIKFLFLFFITFLVTSCEDFLEKEPIGRDTENVFYNDPDNALLAVNACYDVLTWGQGPVPTNPTSASYLGHFEEFMIGDILTDDAKKGGSGPSDEKSIQQMKEWRVTPQSDKVTTLWSNCFAGIYRCNSALQNLSGSTIGDSLKNRLSGEVSFLRAYYYFYLSRVFGGVPLILEPPAKSEAGTFERSSLSAVLSQVEADLLTAISYLPEKSGYAPADMGRATRGAAMAYMARVIMFQLGTDNTNGHAWEEVYQYTDTIIQSGEYYLDQNFASIFEIEGENGPGSIFEVQCKENPAGEDWGSIMGGSMHSVFQGNREHWGWGFNNPTDDLVQEYDQKDPRLPCTVYKENDVVHGVQQKWYASAETDYLSRKAALEPSLRPAGDGKDSPANIRKFRYADVLLMNAEAAYYMGNEPLAIQRVEEVRERARHSTKPKGTAIGETSYESYLEGEVYIPEVNPSLTGRNLLEVIWRERRVELAMEGLRYFDLVRTGRYLDALPDEDTKSRCRAKCAEVFNVDGVLIYLPLLPLPATEVESWGLTQNDGYQ